ncbi:hypothetical protein JZ751_007493 [Albula glossodonta]|uniref:Transmembrane channel-like protein n=1 Tax=Albula glossodonta TaxID=121402 RepID=A0A8T2NDJ9_9TELE|nr:hypothetical protein JZ751_007493 [Albula glossodonta]
MAARNINFDMDLHHMEIKKAPSLHLTVTASISFRSKKIDLICVTFPSLACALGPLAVREVVLTLDLDCSSNAFWISGLTTVALRVSLPNLLGLDCADIAPWPVSVVAIVDQQTSGSLDQGHGALELEDLSDERRDHVTYLAAPSWAEHGQQRGQDLEVAMVNDPLIDERWSSATLRVLSSMPSRTIGRSRGAIISQYYNRTMQLCRRRQTRPTIRDFSRSARPSIRGYGVESDCGDGSEEERKKDQLVNNLQKLSISDRVRMLRAMPLSVAEKSDLRKRAYNYKEGRPVSSSQMSCCSRLKYYIIIALRQSWYSWLSFLHSLQLWQVPLKRVSGRFGTGVLSYFLFLKILLFFNIFLFLINGFFLVLPQAIHRPPPANLSQKFTGLELLTGGGSFTDTVMFYGHYSHRTLTSGCRHSDNASVPTDQPGCPPRLSFNMPLAYFFTIGVSFFITCIILVYSMSKSFGKSFRINKSQGYLAVKVFSSWDFKVIKRTSVRLQSENICTQLKDLETRVLETRDLETRDLETGQRLLEQQASLLALPVVVSSLNLLMPGLFNAVGWMEVYDSPSIRTYVAIFRNLLLKVSMLGVLCYHWLGRVAADPGKLLLQAGKQWMLELKTANPNLTWLTWIHTTMVENPLFLFISAGIFLMVIYFHTQVVDGQRKVISLLQEQIENKYPWRPPGGSTASGNPILYLSVSGEKLEALHEPISREGRCTRMQGCSITKGRSAALTQGHHSFITFKRRYWGHVESFTSHRSTMRASGKKAFKLRGETNGSERIFYFNQSQCRAGTVGELKMEDREQEVNFKKETVGKLLSLFFRDEKSRVSSDAATLMTEMLKVFVQEAARRAAKQAETEDNHTVKSDPNGQL